MTLKDKTPRDRLLDANHRLRDAFRDASELAASHPDASLTAARACAEHLLDYIADSHSLAKLGRGEKRAAYIQRLEDAKCFSRSHAALFNLVRTRGDPATHRRKKSSETEAIEVVGIIECLLDSYAKPIDLGARPIIDGALVRDTSVFDKDGVAETSIRTAPVRHSAVDSTARDGDADSMHRTRGNILVLIATRTEDHVFVALTECGPDSVCMPRYSVAEGEDIEVIAREFLREILPNLSETVTHLSLVPIPKARLVDCSIQIFINPLECYFVDVTATATGQLPVLSEEYYVRWFGISEAVRKLYDEDVPRLATILGDLFDLK